MGILEQLRDDAAKGKIRRNNDRTPVASVDLKAAGAAQAALLRRALATPKPASPVAQRVAAVKARHTAPQTDVQRESVRIANLPAKQQFAAIDAIANTVPVGRYALRRGAVSAAGNDITFFEVRQVKGQNRIVQLIGGVGSFTRQSLKVGHQFWALQHVLEDIAGAMKLYGDETRECGMCAANGRRSPLTQKRSRDAGYGERCAEKYGLPY